jgi:hypothetical protein|tara:strand:- start:158 stop:880 length:723 start_codon:yes stop_codon:yes gene_type:complete
MVFFEILIIVFLIFFQSIFGIGLLLFGTPTFLLIGYNFLDVLNILLPVSITISLIQFFSSNVINKKFKYNFNFFCLPFLIFSLYFIINNVDKINLELYISILIIFFSILSLNKKKFKYLKNFSLTKQRIYLSVLGAIHGLSNLGGSLLTILSSIINDEDKNKTRYCIAYGYLIMGTVQILALYFFSDSRIKIVNLLYIALVFIIYFPSQKIFNNFKGEKFSNFLNIFALFYGIIILIKNI